MLPEPWWRMSIILPHWPDCRIFHFGSLSLTQEPSRGTTLEAIRIAKDAGALISYDPNYRASLWPDEETAVAQMKSVIPLADVM